MALFVYQLIEVGWGGEVVWGEIVKYVREYILQLRISLLKIQ